MPLRGGLVLKAGGGPRAPFFSLLAQRKEGKRKGTPTTCPSLRCGFPARFGQNRRCGIVSGLTPLTLRAPQAATTGQARFIAISDRSDSPRFSRFCPAVLGCAEGDEVLCGNKHGFTWCRHGEISPPSATSGRRATQHPAGESECRSEATHERGGMRVAEGSHRSAVTGLLEQMLLPPFGETKGGRVRAAARIENKSARSAQQIQA